jgi:hypothetical protein
MTIFWILNTASVAGGPADHSLSPFLEVSLAPRHNITLSLKRSRNRQNSRPVVQKEMTIRRSRNIFLQLILELSVHVESARAAVPVDAVVVDAGEGV